MQQRNMRAHQEDTPGQQEHILVVDDDSALLRLLVELLERSGYDVSAAANAEQALLHLLDVIGRDHPGLPVVMLTAVHDVHVATSAFRRGAADYLLKPFERTQLLNAVARALEHGLLQRQNSA